jgi:hypothetical protein
MAETQVCQQCHVEKDMERFGQVKNMYTALHRMPICKDCYKSDREERKRREAEEWEARRLAREAEEREAQRRREEWRTQCQAYEAEVEQRRLARQQALDTWYLQQPERRCVDCKQVLTASAFDYSTIRVLEGVWIPASLHKRCKPCHEAYRARNQQIYPPCPMCKTPTRRREFLCEYKDFDLDLIKICCENCIPQFESLPETEQLELLRCAMVKAYGETAVIYALQYDNHFPCQHIGRTKHYDRRMREYRKDWYKDIQHNFILQHLSFGPISMEYESRWIMYALKHQWPIDNFELFKGGEDGLSGQRQQALLTEAVQSFEPLTAPFEVVAPLIRENFGNTGDTAIVNWYCSQYYRSAYPGENDMVQRVALMERLHGLRK